MSPSRLVRSSQLSPTRPFPHPLKLVVVVAYDEHLVVVLVQIADTDEIVSVVMDVASVREDVVGIYKGQDSHQLCERPHADN